MQLRLSIMQPYFFPYLGYFRLFRDADKFVIFDNVQFPRRGWVHRNRGLVGDDWVWITLPLRKASQTTLINELEFRDADLEPWIEKQKSYISRIQGPLGMQVEDIPWPNIAEKPIDYLQRSLQWVLAGLCLDCEVVRSSDLNVALCGLDGEQKILKICTAQRATDYINLPGGVSLYSPSQFQNAGVNLKFLTGDVDSYESVLFRIVREGFGPLRMALNELP